MGVKHKRPHFFKILNSHKNNKKKYKLIFKLFIIILFYRAFVRPSMSFTLMILLLLQSFFFAYQQVLRQVFFDLSHDFTSKIFAILGRLMTLKPLKMPFTLRKKEDHDCLDHWVLQGLWVSLCPNPVVPSGHHKQSGHLNAFAPIRHIIHVIDEANENNEDGHLFNWQGLLACGLAVSKQYIT